MSVVTSRVLRTFRITILMLIWFSIGITGSSFAIGNFILGTITLVTAGILVIILIDGRLFDKLRGRPMPGRSLLGFYVVIAVLVRGSIRELQLNDIFVLDELYLPSLIGAIQAVGAFILAAILLWETIALTRQHFVSKQ